MAVAQLEATMRLYSFGQDCGVLRKRPDGKAKRCWAEVGPIDAQQLVGASTGSPSSRTDGGSTS